MLAACLGLLCLEDIREDVALYVGDEEGHVGPGLPDGVPHLKITPTPLLAVLDEAKEHDEPTQDLADTYCSQWKGSGPFVSVSIFQEPQFTTVDNDIELICFDTEVINLYN